MTQQLKNEELPLGASVNTKSIIVRKPNQEIHESKEQLSEGGIDL